MTRCERLLCALGASGMIACGNPVPPAPSRPAFPDLPVLSATALSFEPTTETRAAMVTSVIAQVTVRHAEGAHRIWADFHAPDGTSYQRSVNGVQEVWTDTPLRFTLPVSGTVIDSSALVGTWSVQVLVDGVALESLSFNLDP